MKSYQLSVIRGGNQLSVISYWLSVGKSQLSVLIVWMVEIVDFVKKALMQENA
jgi:hypothetical protein